MTEKEEGRFFIQQWRLECLLLDQFYEIMRYQISHKLLEEREKESLQGDFHQFELNELNIMLFVHLEKLQ